MVDPDAVRARPASHAGHHHHPRGRKRDAPSPAPGEPQTIRADPLPHDGRQAGAERKHETPLQRGHVLAPHYPGKKRKPVVTKICACGCNQKFKSSNAKKKFKNKAHKQKYYRALRSVS
jgi:hypothetical protein